MITGIQPNLFDRKHPVESCNDRRSEWMTTICSSSQAKTRRIPNRLRFDWYFHSFLDGFQQPRSGEDRAKQLEFDKNLRYKTVTPSHPSPPSSENRINGSSTVIRPSSVHQRRPPLLLLLLIIRSRIDKRIDHLGAKLFPGFLQRAEETVFRGRVLVAGPFFFVAVRAGERASRRAEGQTEQDVTKFEGCGSGQRGEVTSD